MSAPARPVVRTSPTMQLGTKDPAAGRTRESSSVQDTECRLPSSYPPDSTACCVDPTDLAEAIELLGGGAEEPEAHDNCQRKSAGAHMGQSRTSSLGKVQSVRHFRAEGPKQESEPVQKNGECTQERAEGGPKLTRGFSRQRSLHRYPTIGRSAVPEYKMGAVIDGVRAPPDATVAVENLSSETECKLEEPAAEMVGNKDGKGTEVRSERGEDGVMRLSGGEEQEKGQERREGPGPRRRLLAEPSPRSVLKELGVDKHLGSPTWSQRSPEDKEASRAVNREEPPEPVAPGGGLFLPANGVPDRARSAEIERGWIEQEIPPTSGDAHEKQTKPYFLKSCMVGGILFEIHPRYSPIRLLGKGAYGVVCSALDAVTNEEVAIKKIHGAFQHTSEAKRTLREIKLLQHLQHENIIGIRDVIRPRDLASFRDVYIVYELMDADLHHVIASNEPLTEYHCQYFLYQLLRGLKFMHSAHVLHRDLKPGNLLVNANCDLKIADFGLARSLDDGRAAKVSPKDHTLTEYVVTRWYRAPELLLSCSEYGPGIDVWSVGCIFAELLRRKALFPGKDTMHQLKLILEALGVPRSKDLEWVTSPTAKGFLQGLKLPPPKGLKKLVPQASPMALDLLTKMLNLNPANRITVDDAFEHPYLELLHDPEDVIVAGEPFTLFEEEGGDHTVKLNRAKELIFQEALHYNPS